MPSSVTQNWGLRINILCKVSKSTTSRRTAGAGAGAARAIPRRSERINVTFMMISWSWWLRWRDLNESGIALLDGWRCFDLMGTDISYLGWSLLFMLLDSTLIHTSHRPPLSGGVPSERTQVILTIVNATSWWKSHRRRRRLPGCLLGYKTGLDELFSRIYLESIAFKIKSYYIFLKFYRH